MKILVLGGTIFVGRYVVEAALERGHEVTMFNRGQRNADLFPEVEKLRGNRDGDLKALEGREWDAVVDPSAYVPRIAGASAQLLADKIGNYTFISSLAVYGDISKPGNPEGSALAKLADESVESVTGETYGALKALCEAAVEEAVPGRALNIRPGYIVGPHDPTDRFTYWVRRTSQGGKMLAPGNPNDPFQVIDVRDLAGWIIRLIEQKQTGVFNATGPDFPLTMGRVLEVAKEVSGSDAEFVWVDEETLLKNNLVNGELPLWAPGSGDYAGIHRVSIEKALAHGLTFRPLADTIRATLEYDRALPQDARRVGLSREKEQELLQSF